mgnify:FL=1
MRLVLLEPRPIGVLVKGVVSTGGQGLLRGTFGDWARHRLVYRAMACRGAWGGGGGGSDCKRCSWRAGWGVEEDALGEEELHLKSWTHEAGSR